MEIYILILGNLPHLARDSNKKNFIVTTQQDPRFHARVKVDNVLKTLHIFKIFGLQNYRTVDMNGGSLSPSDWHNLYESVFKEHQGEKEYTDKLEEQITLYQVSVYEYFQGNSFLYLVYTTNLYKTIKVLLY